MALPPPDLNNTAEQQAEAARQEAARKAAAAKAAADAKAAGERRDAFVEGESDGGGIFLQGGGNKTLNAIGEANTSAQKWIGKTADDMFSAETVNGPGAGSWGQSTTPAAYYNAGQAEAGEAARAGYAKQAERAGNVASAGAGTANRRATTSYARGAPVTNYAQAENAAAGAQGTVDALNTFAGQQDGPSGAQAQLNQATQTGLAQQLAMARSGRGFGGNSAAMGQAQGAMAGVTANAANESAALKAREFATARERQLNALNYSLGGAQDLESQAADRAQYLTDSQYKNRELNDAAALEQGRLGLDYEKFGTDARTGYGELGEKTALDRAELGQRALTEQAKYELDQQKMALDAAKANQSADTERDKANTGMVGGFLKMLSDRQSKEKIQKLEGALSKSLGGKGDALETVSGAQGYSYNYKDPSQPGAKAGRMVGPMAQDLEKGPLGDTLVTDTPQGKMVDTPRLSMVTASAVAEQQKQLDALKRALGSGKAA